MMNGVGVRFAGNGNQRSDLLDMTPGSPDGRNDSALVIGRTFSDYAAGVHITPIGFGHTSPESLDVVVTLGNTPGNHAPTLAISTARLSVAPAQWLQLTANATDSDGDALAYYWDFGDGEFGTNGTVAVHRWFSHGERIVRCVVSDMKGGHASDSVLVTVGTPPQYRISGRVAEEGRPLEGVRVFVSSTDVAYTDSRGLYNLVNLPQGSYTVAASVEGHRAVPAQFVNPVSVGPSAENVDFIVADPAEFTAISLVSTGSVWRYLTSRTNLDSSWKSAGYQDDAWSAGPAQLGYGDADEATVLDFGNDPANKPLATYFRQEFSVERPTDFARLELAVLRDDGAVVYLNGNEIFRSNMPDGAVTATTLAVTTVGGNDERVFYSATVDSDSLIPGRNLVAVEVHQANPTSSDLSFDLRLRGLVASNQLVAAGAVWKYLYLEVLVFGAAQLAAAQL
jgi:hypothetical protein